MSEISVAAIEKMNTIAARLNREVIKALPAKENLAWTFATSRNVSDYLASPANALVAFHHGRRGTAYKTDSYASSVAHAVGSSGSYQISSDTLNDIAVFAVAYTEITGQVGRIKAEEEEIQSVISKMESKFKGPQS